MKPLPSIPAMIFTAALISAPLLGGPVLAQNAATPPAGNDATIGTAPSTSSPATPTPSTPPGTQPGSEASRALSVATVKLTEGWRASQLLGSSVYNEQGQDVGKLDDLVMTREDKVMVAIISVGGFLGIGSKLVAIPWEQFRFTPDQRLTLPNASKEALNGLPSFTYGS
jgi:sporulation protein YlmC with PRC-barrel domain